MMRNKIFILLSVYAIALPSFAGALIQPIIHSKVYSTWQVPLKSFAKPQQIIKGEADECNGGYFPDEYRYTGFSVLSTGIIREVILNQQNGLLFHQQKVVGGIDQASFLKKFKNKVWQDDSDKNIMNGEGLDGQSIQFIFKNGKLEKYRIWMDDC